MTPAPPPTPARPRAVPFPNVDDLHAAPQLAVLAILESNALVALLALGAAHPDLHDATDDHDDSELRAALALLDAARTLAETVRRYRAAIALAAQRDELLPF